MSNNATLSAATQDRKARLAQLKSLKRKQHQTDDGSSSGLAGPSDEAEGPPRKRKSRSRSASPDVTETILSGRNYDASTRGPKLGFETQPNATQSTLESKAQELAEEVKRRQEEEEKSDKPLDLFKLQPKKPNWDLKRELDRRMQVLNVRTENAIARIVRDRISKAQKDAKAKTGADGEEDGEAVGIDGVTLVEATREMEREEAEEEKREREEDGFA